MFENFKVEEYMVEKFIVKDFMAKEFMVEKFMVKELGDQVRITFTWKYSCACSASYD